LVISYYREKKDIVKKKEKKLLGGQIQKVRYLMKMSLFSLITSRDYNKTIKRLLEAYGILKSTLMGGINTRVGLDERRENADILAVLILKMRLSSN
jgi:hypothetical protein